MAVVAALALNALGFVPIYLNALGFVPIYLQRGEPYGWLWGGLFFVFITLGR